MNVLSYRTTEDNGLSFDLLVDGEPIQHLCESDSIGVPYWYLENGLTPITVMGTEHRIVAVCGCGETGCGFLDCIVTENEEEVTFDFFDGKLIFKFAMENYRQVLDEIAQEVLKFTGPQTEIATAQHNFDVMKAYLNAVDELLRKPSTRNCIAESCGIENYGAQEAADWICDPGNHESVRNLILLDKNRFLLLESGPVSPPIVQHDHIPWTIKVSTYDENTKLICVGYLEKVGDCVGTKSLKFERAKGIDN